jgi:hypothetical protein
VAWHPASSTSASGRRTCWTGCAASKGHELTFFSMVATFGTPLDITLDELAIESFFPADPETASVLQAAAAPASGGSRPGEVGCGRSLGADHVV